MAVLAAPDVYQRLSQDAEDAIDRAAVVLSAEDDDFIPWDAVKAELSLT